jgi:hypothetical protein
VYCRGGTLGFLLPAEPLAAREVAEILKVLRIGWL